MTVAAVLESRWTRLNTKRRERSLYGSEHTVLQVVEDALPKVRELFWMEQVVSGMMSD